MYAIVKLGYLHKSLYWIQFCFEGAIGTTLGEGDGPIVLHNVFCMGNETKLADCQQLTSYYCYGFAPVAGVVCQGEYTNAYTHA